MNLVEIPSYVPLWPHDLLLKCDLILYPNIRFLQFFSQHCQSRLVEQSVRLVYLTA